MNIHEAQVRQFVGSKITRLVSPTAGDPSTRARKMTVPRKLVDSAETSTMTVPALDGVKFRNVNITGIPVSASRASN